MVFTLDEELDELTITDSDNEEAPQQLLQPPGADHVARRRRRSSKLEKLPVIAPPHSRRLSVSVGEGQASSLDPKVLSDFKPVRALGQGAYGKVILVKDDSTSKLYAMKQLQKAEIIIENEDTPDVSKRVERIFAERTILSQLDHPNVVKLFYTFHDNSKLYLLLQYIPGGELFYHLKERGTLDEDTAAFYAAEISCALKFLHQKGIVYRDLKPENCLLDARGHLVLTDFGLSKKSVDENSSSSPAEDVSELHSIIGTPEYCAPEILQGLPYTRNCDWYSLGCLVYDMLVGKPPYTGANHKVILNKIQKEKAGPRIPYYLSEGMKDWLGALLKKDRNKRWDVDRYWAAPLTTKKESGSRKKKRRAGQERVSPYTTHFVFRKINWTMMQDGALQRGEQGPIMPVITDLELAENFDEEFTSLACEDDDRETTATFKSDVFKGFSYKASGSYLEKYF
ncbi:YPK3 (YBR028C) [Zygosaccharomyces parabailii]|uniref:ZYBA0S03-07998g1_1 n=1 Tax=Zygosaccharomyces bailii (strain CLIB 213 / ATCC 58445 / CBS 680 / BCRC 21525 / NBRC 1098 / NCYC 1416 / NRRL Y-2227) TaxID=1333698 RepID=A0A8J2T4W9_ZYGB2|nr:YPK3 (YBR028C) [Zygosaccharomyces parabailii]CDF89050.1 ZYBA0S03-07998g1_1 [Zygosaccharomyces bailii CLIB 213]CDH16134.1 uncharacterized protein ZBAI_07922 [Zygosaccharomyces bailii ISA1307]SJM83232.1 related to AGC kinase YPK3 [Zygosaccharomyces bailii]